jgi:hypothetical protein
MPQSLSQDSELAWDNLTPAITWDGFVTTTKPKRPMASGKRKLLWIRNRGEKRIEIDDVHMTAKTTQL